MQKETNKKTKNQAITEKKEEKKSCSIFIISTVIFALLSGVLGYLYYTAENEITLLETKVVDTKAEKEKVEADLKDLLSDYEALETDNDSITSQLNVEKERIKELLDEIKNVKANSAWQINKYKKEIKTLRAIMRDFVVQIDSLNTLNQELKAENLEVKQNFKQAKSNNAELKEANSELSNKVELASVIKAKNIDPSPLNKRSKPITKARKVTKIRTCFTLMENDIVTPGVKDVYVRIARPDGLVLATKADNLFEFEGDMIVYTAKRQAEYQNKDLDMCIYWDNNQELLPGKYIVDIFIDGNQVGTSSFDIK